MEDRAEENKEALCDERNAQSKGHFEAIGEFGDERTKTSDPTQTPVSSPLKAASS